jgi:hypothetical protein
MSLLKSMVGLWKRFSLGQKIVFVVLVLFYAAMAAIATGHYPKQLFGI